MKNFVQILNFAKNSELYCFDINDIPKKYTKLYEDKNLIDSKKLLSGELNSNKIHYLKEMFYLSLML